MCLAIPFFIIGHEVRLRERIIEFPLKRLPNYYKLVLFLICFLLLFLISDANGVPFMVSCKYGNNIMLFFLSGFIGTLMIMLLSMTLESTNGKLLKTLSKGTILILALQMPLVRAIAKICNIFGISNVANDDYFTFVSSIIILIMFYPIILFCKKYIPCLLGYRK